MGLSIFIRHTAWRILVLTGICSLMGCGGAAKEATSSQSIFITATSSNLMPGSSQSIRAVGSDQAQTDITASVNWSSSSPSVAVISTAGVVTAQSVGTTTITASLNGAVSNSLILTVRAVASLAISAPVSSQSSGTSQQLAAMVTFSDGSTQSVSDAVTWVSSNSTALSISAAGLATANSAGLATVRATYSGVSSNTLSLTVTNGSLTVSSLVISPGTLIVVSGTTQQLVATAIYSDGTTGIVTAYATWSTSASSVGTVTASGGCYQQFPMEPEPFPHPTGA